MTLNTKPHSGPPIDASGDVKPPRLYDHLPPNVFQKETKTAKNRPILFCLVYQRVFGHFATIPHYFRRFPETTEDPRRQPRMSEDCRRCLRTTEDFRGEIRKFSKSR